MRKEQTTTVYECDICHKSLVKKPDMIWDVPRKYYMDQTGGVRITVQTYGIPVNEMIVCEDCQVETFKYLAGY